MKNNTRLMEKARNIMINSKMEGLIATNIKRNGFTFEEAMLLVFFREIMPTDHYPERLIYKASNGRRFMLIVDYDFYKKS